MIIVTGGLGFLGAYVTRAIRESGRDALAVGRRVDQLPAVLRACPFDVEVESLDATAEPAWDELLATHPAEAIVHLAAAPISTTPLDQVLANVSALGVTLRAAARAGVRRVVVASTIGVYAGGDQASPYVEDAPLPLTGLHGIQASKKIGEIIGDLVTRHGDLEVIDARIPAIWGPGGRTSSPFFDLPAMVHAAASGSSVEVVADGAIDAPYVADAAAAILALTVAGKLRHRVYNVGAGRAISNREVAEAILAVRPEASISLIANSDAPAPAYLDRTRLLADTDYRDAHDLPGGIREYLEWLAAGHER